MGEFTDSDEGRFRSDTGPLFDIPRIRQITGIRIHQLTLPQSLVYASKLTPSSSRLSHPIPDHQISTSTSTSTSTLTSRPRTQRENSTTREKSSIPYSPSQSRTRSTSISQLSQSPPSPSIHPLRSRSSRPRAPTLAGEAIEHALQGFAVREEIIDEVGSSFSERVGGRRLVRCFVTLSIPPSYSVTGCMSSSGREEVGNHETRVEEVDGGVPLPKRSQGNERRSDRPASATGSLSMRSGAKASNLQVKSTISRNSPSTSPSPSPNPIRRPTLSTSSSRSSVSSSSSPTLTGTSSPPTEATSNHDGIDPGTGRNVRKDGNFKTRPVSPSFHRPGSSSSMMIRRTNSDFARRPSPTKPLVNGSKHIMTSSHLSSGNLSDKNLIASQPSTSTLSNIFPKVPFYISPIYPPSTHPRFTISLETDFANWLTVEEAASSEVIFETWIEDRPSTPNLRDHESSEGWRKLSSLSGNLKLSDLRRLTPETRLLKNTILVTLSTDSKSVFYFSFDDQLKVGVRDGKEGIQRSMETDSGVVERSLRETRMKKGVGVGGLYQLVNIQAVITDTERNIIQVQDKICNLLTKDVDRRALRRDIHEREEKVRWVSDRIAEVEKSIREATARITLLEQGIDTRRSHLVKAEQSDHLLRGRIADHEEDINDVEDERLALLPTITRLRAFHVQTLDSLFPITPLSPSSLLYSILEVPLPIPVGPKDPAPPMTLQASALPEEGRGKVTKIDEKSTATALGYVAMVLQVLAGLVGWGGIGVQGGGLPYPVTCVGSRSLVRDVISVMQGPRSFPLYAKGVERYRYEYAVFLLNKNIELLMQESNIRLLDIRHTLPNLKNLLVTLSSPIPQSPTPIFSPTSRPGSRSEASSRQTSRAFSRGFTPLDSGVGLNSPGSSGGGRSGIVGAYGTGRVLDGEFGGEGSPGRSRTGY